MTEDNKITIGQQEYEIDNDGRIIGALAYCHGEDHNSHPYCYSAPEGFEKAEQEKRISRHYDGSG